MAKHGPLDSFGTILSGLAKRLGLDTHLFERRLQQEWHRIVGEPIASHTWPDHIRFKKLYLTVQNSVWMKQLTFLKKALLVKVNAQSGSLPISDMIIRVGEIPQADRSQNMCSIEHPTPAMTDEAWSEASIHAATVLDPDLRDRLTEVMAHALTRAKSGR